MTIKDSLASSESIRNGTGNDTPTSFRQEPGPGLEFFVVDKKGSETCEKNEEQLPNGNGLKNPALQFNSLTGVGQSQNMGSISNAVTSHTVAEEHSKTAKTPKNSKQASTILHCKHFAKYSSV